MGISSSRAKRIQELDEEKERLNQKILECKAENELLKKENEEWMSEKAEWKRTGLDLNSLKQIRQYWTGLKPEIYKALEQKEGQETWAGLKGKAELMMSALERRVEKKEAGDLALFLEFSEEADYMQNQAPNLE